MTPPTIAPVFTWLEPPEVELPPSLAGAPELEEAVPPLASKEESPLEEAVPPPTSEEELPLEEASPALLPEFPEVPPVSPEAPSPEDSPPEEGIGPGGNAVSPRAFETMEVTKTAPLATSFDIAPSVEEVGVSEALNKASTNCPLEIQVPAVTGWWTPLNAPADPSEVA